MFLKYVEDIRNRILLSVINTSIMYSRDSWLRGVAVSQRARRGRNTSPRTALRSRHFSSARGSPAPAAGL
jgi:hypothetical protein